MRLLNFICLLQAAGVLASAIAFYPRDKAGAAIKKALKTKDVEIMADIDLNGFNTEEQRIKIYRFRLKTESDDRYAVFAESMGRYEFFEYLVITGPAGDVQKVEVLKYRSEHGGEVASRKWLSQFLGYRGGELIYGKDISAITGATLSAQSITRDMQKIIAELQNHLNQNSE